MRKTFTYLWSWFANPARFRSQVARPTLINLAVTDTCNARCVMCDIWKVNATDDIDISESTKILKDPLFSSVKHVGLSGGEPMLRSDLPAIVEVLVSNLPALKTVSVTSHGFNVVRHQKNLPLISSICKQAGVHFTLNLSMDGVGVVHEKVRGVPGGFAKTEKVLQFALNSGISVQLQSTVSKLNVYHLPFLRRYAEQRRLPIIFRLATDIERLGNRDSIGAVALNEGERSFFADFILDERTTKIAGSLARSLFYKDLAKRLVSDQARKAPCYFQREAVYLAANGTIYPCSLSKEAFGNGIQTSPALLYFSDVADSVRSKLYREKCSSCEHDQSGAWTPIQIALELADIKLGWRKHCRKLNHGLAFIFSLGLMFIDAVKNNGLQTAALVPGHLRSAILFGCYGGEHVGDAAILGGVISRLRKRFGIEHFIVLSFRPDRTRRWIESLQMTEAMVSVEGYGSLRRDDLPLADMAVLAGGPIMDLPSLLASHYRLVRVMRKRNIPVLIEGCGIGPLNNPWCSRFALAILRSAVSVSLRTRRSVEWAAKWGVRGSLEPDPAFDFLNNMSDCSIHNIRAGKQTKPVIGINLRPYWDRYRYGGSEHTQELTERTVASICEFMERNAARFDFVFFAMNADQYGMSDFDMAIALGERLSEKVNFRVVERELSPFELRSLVGTFVAVIAMRFHACIFALSAQVPVIGIDYGMGGKSKVHELFDDRGLTDQVISCTNLDLKALEDRLERLLPEGMARGAN